MNLVCISPGDSFIVVTLPSLKEKHSSSLKNNVFKFNFYLFILILIIERKKKNLVSSSSSLIRYCFLLTTAAVVSPCLLCRQPDPAGVNEEEEEQDCCTCTWLEEGLDNDVFMLCFNRLVGLKKLGSLIIMLSMLIWLAVRSFASSVVDKVYHRSKKVIIIGKKYKNE